MWPPVLLYIWKYNETPVMENHGIFWNFQKFTFWYKRQLVTTSFALFSILTKSRRNWISLLNCESILAMIAARSLNEIGIFTFPSFLNFFYGFYPV